MVLNPPRDPAHLKVVAEIGERHILYGDIACDRMIVARSEKWRGGRSVDQVCAEIEQQAFAGAVIRHLQEAACALEECALTDADIAPFRKLFDDAFVEKAASLQRRQAEAMARALKGEDADAVYAEVGDRIGQTLDQFRFEIGRYEAMWAKPVEMIDKLLAKDFAAMFREGNEKAAKRQAMRAFLRSRIAANAGDRSLDEAADAYLAALVQKIGVRLLDERFKLPKGNEVFL